MQVGERRAQSRSSRGLPKSPPSCPIRHRTHTGLQSVRFHLLSLGHEVRLCLAAAVWRGGSLSSSGLSVRGVGFPKRVKTTAVIQEPGRARSLWQRFPSFPGMRSSDPGGVCLSLFRQVPRSLRRGPRLGCHCFSG